MGVKKNKHPEACFKPHTLAKGNDTALLCKKPVAKK